MALQLLQWSSLINWRPPLALQTDMYNRFQPSYLLERLSDPFAIPLTANFHAIEDADSDRINLDRYAVWIRGLPYDPTSGEQFTPEALLTYMRLNLNTFMTTGTAQVFPYAPRRNDTTNEDEVRWKSPNPLGTVMTFEIPVLDWAPEVLVPLETATVVATLVEPARWIFTPWKTPGDNIHPVSGNREFGFVRSFVGAGTDNPEPGFGFYIRAADRITSAGTPEDKAFDGGKKLWITWQVLFSGWVNTHGGFAEIVDPIQTYVLWSDLKGGVHNPSTPRLHPPVHEIAPV